MAEIKHATDENFAELVLNAGRPVVVDFWAAWCGPCRAMAPEFSKAAQALQGRVRFAKIDTERFPQVSARFGIRGIPLLIRFDKGREAGRLAGARPAAQIADFAAGQAARA
jgi:thioredoxin 2